MTADSTEGVAIASAFVEAMNRRDHDEAARLLAEDVELVFPGTRLESRQAWLESRRRQQTPDQLDESVEVDDTTETDDGVVVSGRLVQRWVETGEVANEMPVQISVSVEGGLIRRLELCPRS